jgi:hypothetical protein
LVHILRENGQLSGRLGLAQDRTGADRQLDRRPEPGFRQGIPAGLPVDSPNDPVRIGLVELGTQLVKDAQGAFGIPAGLFVALAGQMHFGMVQQAQALEVDVTGQRRDLVAASKVPVGVVPQLSIGAHHTQIVVGDGAASFVPDGLESRQRLLVMVERLHQRPLGIGQNPEVLFYPAPQSRVRPTELQSTVELVPGRIDVPALEIEVRQRIERLGGQNRMLHLLGYLVAPLAQLPGYGRLVAIAVDHSEAAQSFGQNLQLRVPL